MKRFLAAAVSAAILFSSVGCGKEEVVTPAENSTAESVAGTESLVPDESVETEKREVKAAALSCNAAKMCLLAGVQLVAAVDEAQNIIGMPDGLTFVGIEEEPSVEDVLNAEPDVVILDKSTPGYISIKDAFADVDCEVVEISDNSFKEYDTSMKLLTDLTGDSEAYEKYVRDVADRNEAIISRALEAAHQVEVTVTENPADGSGNAGNSEETVYYAGRTPSFLVIRAGEENCRAMSNDDYICSMLQDFGMCNANKSGQQVIVWKKTDTAGDESLTDSHVTIQDQDALSSEAVIPEPQAEKMSVELASPISEMATGPAAADSSISVMISETPAETDSIDTFAGEIDKRESEDAGRRTFENLLANNPDFIFIIYDGNEKSASENCRELVKSCENWEKTYAVQSGRVYELPQNSFGCQPNELWDMAYEYLYQTIFVL